MPLIRRLGWHHAVQTVAVRLDRDGCRLHHFERDQARQLANAGTLDSALVVLGLR
nr:hypothetical protein [Micromonospora sp. DSM 115978]